MKRIFILLVLCTLSIPLPGQKLKIRPGDSNRIYRDMQDGHALVMFETSLKDLRILPTLKEDIIKDEKNGSILYFIETDLTGNEEYNIPNERKYLLKSGDSEETILEINDMFPKNVYYYTVVLPIQFPLTFSAEYVFSKSAAHSIRIACGTRYGGYLCYKWGEYHPAGTNIDEYNNPCDVTQAKLLGGIRSSITGGVRIGVVRKYVPTYIYIGGGYGEYGRQWKNPLEISNNIYFHSDYIKGFEGEVGISFAIMKCISLSAGADLLVDNGKISTDFQVGVGISVEPSWLKNLRK